MYVEERRRQAQEKDNNMQRARDLFSFAQSLYGKSSRERRLKSHAFMHKARVGRWVSGWVC
jgi:hypothetical protein